MTKTKQSTLLQQAFSLLLCLVFAFGWIAIPPSSALAQTGNNDLPTQEQSSLTSADSQASSIAERLAAIPGVTSVTPYSNDTIKKRGLDQIYEIFEINFEQPIDHSNSSLGCFNQRLRLYYRTDATTTIVNTDGYAINILPATSINQFIDKDVFAEEGNPNIVDIEYRYFGTSRPEALDDDGVDLWSYMTQTQAAEDFHAIIQGIDTVLPTKRLWTGTSKGGLATTFQCYYAETMGYHDADAFVPFCAPLCEGTSDNRFMDAVNGNIGYGSYGAEQAAAWHELLDRYSVLCIKYRDSLQTKFYEDALASGLKFRESYFGDDPATQAELLWEVAICEFPVGFWQYYQATAVDEITKAIEDAEAGNPAALGELLAKYCEASYFAYNSGFDPYCIQSQLTLGNYCENFDHLRTIVAAARDNAQTQEEKAAYRISTVGNPSNASIYLTSQQQEAFTYDPSERNALVTWLNATDSAHLIIVDGQSDPWYFVGPAQSFENSQIKCYLSTYNHRTKITNLGESEQAEIWATLKSWLYPAQPDPEPEPTPTPEPEPQPKSDGGNSSSASGSTTALANTGDYVPVTGLLFLALSCAVALLVAFAWRKRSARLD